MIYVDTSALVKLYFPEPDSARIARLVQGTSLAFTRLHEIEIELTWLLSRFRFGEARNDISCVDTLVIASE